jgi:hypothetical protein
MDPTGHTSVFITSKDDNYQDGSPRRSRDRGLALTAKRRVAVVAVVGVFAIIGAPSAVAQPVATCTSDIIDGVEVDTCVGNPNANTVSDLLAVNVEFEFGLGVAFGFG